MQRDMDTIQFESRSEIEAIGIALKEYIENHPNDSNIEIVEELFDHLDIMHMNW